MDAHVAGVGSFPLLLANEGERVRIVAYRGGAEFARRMMELGLPVGSEVMIVRRAGRGPLILGRNDIRLGLGVGMAHKILVVPSGGDRP